MTVSVGMDQVRHHIEALAVEVLLAWMMKMELLEYVRFVADRERATRGVVDLNGVSGHTVQVNYAPGSTLTVGDKTYVLKQFHFHHPSEEHINGQGYDMVAHLVHADADGHLAVVAVLLKKGPSNPFLNTVWTNIPKEKEKAVDVSGVSLNVNDLLPADHGYFTFAGSLTTPPCSEGVTWYVLKNQSSL